MEKTLILILFIVFTSCTYNHTEYNHKDYCNQQCVCNGSDPNCIALDSLGDCWHGNYRIERQLHSCDTTTNKNYQRKYWKN